jgi:hypothetical protein
MLIRNASTHHTLPARTVYGVLATFGGVPPINLTDPQPLVAAQPLDACTPLQPAPGAAGPCWRAPLRVCTPRCTRGVSCG